MAGRPGYRPVVALDLNDAGSLHIVMNRSGIIHLAAVLGLWLASAGVVTGEADATKPTAGDGGTVLFLVRHAEKSSNAVGEVSQDPGLTEAGRDRARALARVLGPAGITAIHSTDYRRTLGTARPLADALGREVTIYQPDELGTLAERLRGTGGRHLVVGHSNTTPALVSILGGEPGPPIDEECEYDRLYVLFLGPGGSAATIRQRYGSRSCP